MRIHKRAMKRLALALAVPGMAAGALAGFAAAPALASTAQQSARPPAFERISGFSNDLSSSMNVQVTGGYFDNGSVSLGLLGGLATVSLTQGTQTVYLLPGGFTYNLHPGTCSGTIKLTAGLYILGGTGAYSGVTGTGSATLTGDISVPRQFNGGCNLNIANPMSLAAHLNLVATATLSSTAG
jgi:hypothetical protein